MRIERERVLGSQRGGKEEEEGANLVRDATEKDTDWTARFPHTLDDSNCLNSRLCTVVIAGSGFMADAYDLFVINLVLKCLEQDYEQTSLDKSLIASAALWGAMFGQIVFGFLADRIGRRIIFMTNVIFVTLGAISSACASDAGWFSVYYQIALCRFVLGVGIGGEYPLSATITSESSTSSQRGSQMALVFSMQGIGALLSSLFMYTALAGGASYELTWRLGLAFGALPGVVSFYFRWRMNETEAFETEKANRDRGTVDDDDVCVDANDRPRELTSSSSSIATDALSFASTVSHFREGLQTHGKLLLGTAGSWFIFDVVFYANGMFNSEITSGMGLGSDPQAEALNAIIIGLAALPGYYLSTYFIDRMGRFNIQFMGFCALFLLFGIIAASYDGLKDIHALFFFVYALTFLFSNFGPNATTFIIPGEIFPTKVRATFHGISAASGKFGAAMGSFVFSPIKDSAGLQVVTLLCSLCGLAGAVWTWKYTPNYGPRDIAVGGGLIFGDPKTRTTTTSDESAVETRQAIELAATSVESPLPARGLSAVEI